MKMYETYFWICREEVVCETFWIEDALDKERVEKGNIFITHGDALNKLREIKESEEE